jgi:hypothetical protein
MVKPADYRVVTEVKHITGTRIHLRDYESVLVYNKWDNAIQLSIETFDVQVLVREDRYNARGQRILIWARKNDRWYLDFDGTVWDEEFIPYVYEKVGRRKTAEEFTDQREWEQMCYRPGSKQTPLDSYSRVTDPCIRSTDKMERHF